MKGSVKSSDPTQSNRTTPFASKVWRHTLVVLIGLIAVFQITGGAAGNVDPNREPETGPLLTLTLLPNSSGFSDSADSEYSTGFWFTRNASFSSSYSKQKLYKVRGYVYDRSDKIVKPVTISVVNTRTGYRQTTTEQGQFRLMLAPGRYNFSIRDTAGNFDNFEGVEIYSDTSINFIFTGRRRAPDPVPTGSLTASPARIEMGGAATLSWSVAGAGTISIDQGIGTVGRSGSRSVSPTSTTTYKLSASNSGGKMEKSVTITVDEPSGPLPSATFASTARTINRGQSVTLSWRTNNAKSVTLDHGIGSVKLNGSISVTPSSSRTYLLTVANEEGIIFRTLAVKVVEPRNEDEDEDDDDTVDPDDTNENVNTEIENTNTNSVNSDIANSNTNDNRGPGPTPPGPGPGESDWIQKVIYTLLGIGAVLGLGFALWGLLPILIPFAASALGALGLAGKTAEGDDVHCTLYTQPEVSAGTDLLVQIFAHLLEQADALDELAQELDPDAKKQLSKALKQKIKRDSVLTFKLMVPGIELDEEEQDIVWRGEPESVEFIIPIPPEHAAGKRFGRVFVYNNGEEIGKIPFRINILPLALQLDASSVTPRVGGVMTDNETAFVSYASRDKDKVYRFVQLMDVLKYKYHIDIFHIDAGERWEQKLYEFIDKDDVFLLFWSEAASRSEWVIKEAQLAKERMTKDPKSRPRIIIYNLDGRADVPEWLQDIHVDRKWAEIIGTIEDQASQNI